MQTTETDVYGQVVESVYDAATQTTPGVVPSDITLDGSLLGSLPQNPPLTRYLFTGRERDSFTGLQFSRARFYDPNLGRFISEDPIGFGGGDVNLYGYVWNNPVNFYDPSGLFPFSFPCWPASQCADQLDQAIDSALSRMGGDPIVSFGPLLHRPVHLSEYFKDPVSLLRVGSKSGAALDADIPDYQKFEAYCDDAVGAGSLFLMMAGPASAELNAGRSFNPFKGKTSSEIDEMFINKGYTPKGPDPMNGRGTYVNPKNGRGYHVDANHPPGKPPHVGAHRPRGYRGPLDTRDFPF